ncbi:Twin-arginine translocation pathway signal [Alsobacter soli]|uniref:Twin-arginine translocation pathway signal n=1 Tax=Alsobacter soli TaxID=2109933 RepID=A0A2T1HT97_9HYPH|nr:gluconate 2-dehydrogenase subunit 3 family protein [Alsobacter soli]PSC04876.1 Twin-arginine translocation pathway signal [Alsobacter soli]
MQEQHTRDPGAPADPGRRAFLASGAAIAVTGSALIHAGEAWGMEVKNLKPETMQTLIRMARDIYPHDRLSDRYYAVAVKGYDEKAGSDPATKKMIEDGVAALNAAAKKKYGVPYAQVGWEAQRVALLKEQQKTKFFQTVRSNLVVGLYNQKEVWPLFGYEGESASKGCYINRGFNDIAWL